MNNYIVIAHNNGADKLSLLLQDLKEHSTHGWKVCVVDTGSTDEKSLDYLEYINKHEDIRILKRVGGYLTGAWISAYQELPNANQLLFIHDSMRVCHTRYLPNFVTPFETIDSLGAVAYAGFTFPSWDSQYQVDWLGKKYDVNNHPELGIFGSCFLTSVNVLDDLNLKNLLPSIENDKVECMANERGWALAFYQAGYKVYHLVPNFHNILYGSDCGTGLRKIFYGRG